MKPRGGKRPLGRSRRARFKKDELQYKLKPWVSLPVRKGFWLESYLAVVWGK